MTTKQWHIFSSNPSKRAAEIYYLSFFVLSLPFQAWIQSGLSYTEPNDFTLILQGLAMGIGAWLGTLVFRAKEDRGRPFYEVYGFKLGCFLFVWAVIGGYLGTDPWYEVLGGHFAFGTEFNPNGVPFFMLPMTISVFGAYATILGVLFRLIWQVYQRAGTLSVPDWIVKVVVFIPLASLMPLVETLGYAGERYCFDNPIGQWYLNVLIYGSWHLAALPFYTSFDENPGEAQTIRQYWIKGFATVGILMLLMQVVSEWVAPHYTTVHEGARHLDDWSEDNCLGPKPDGN